MARKEAKADDNGDKMRKELRTRTSESGRIVMREAVEAG